MKAVRWFLASTILFGCGDDGSGQGREAPPVMADFPDVSAGGSISSGGLPGVPPPGVGGAAISGSGGLPSAGGATPVPPGSGGADPQGSGGAAPQGTGGANPPGSGGAPPTPGPEDGDPNAPIFTTPDVPCGGPQSPLSLSNFTMDGRPLVVTYACNKHAGAPMMFFLNLHGTTPVAQHFYQHRYFSIHTLAASHNVIVVTPSSVVEQWGNGDNGEDLPHLLKVIDWVYATFDGPGKFDIRSMWVGGHSWGAMYTTTFVCRSEVASRVKGAVIMSGLGRNPACASAISVISTAAQDDIGPVVNQGTVPESHGCDASMMNTIGNNDETHWPNCDPGFVHANYYMRGKTHTSSIDAAVVERIATLMKQARP